MSRKSPTALATLLAIMLAAIPAVAATAAEHDGAPHATFALTIEHAKADGKIESRQYRREWRGCHYLRNNVRDVVYIDVPSGDDYYTRQYPGHRYRGTQFGVNFINRRAWLRVYFGPRAYLYSAAGAHEPVYYQLVLDESDGSFKLEGGLKQGRFTIVADSLKIEEGFPWFNARIKKGARVTWRNCQRTYKRNISIGLFD